MVKKIKKDFVVIGGGWAGLCAAITAARNGIKVALINDRDVLGGNASSEHRVHVNGGGSESSSYYSRESGIADELKLAVLYANPVYNKKRDCHLSDMALADVVMGEKNIEYFPGTSVFDCEKSGERITKVLGFKTKTGEIIEFEGNFFCDASGDGIVGYKAGAEFRVGREARSEFNEELAPEIADENVMGSCVLFTVRDTGAPAPFKRPEFAYNFFKDDILKYFNRPETGRRMPKNNGPYDIWWLEYGGMCDTILDSDHIDLELRKLVYGYWDYIKNSGNYPETENLVIDWIAPAASKRESRRFMAPYIMTANDILDGVDFPDAVATGGWPLDIHDVGGIYGTEKTSAYASVPSMYNIPFSIMYSKDIDNLFLAGRLVSCSHVALGSLRLMETLGAMGQAVGSAAVLCQKHNESPSQINKNRIDELVDMLQRDGQFILNRTEDVGLAKIAKITASSEKPFENTREDSEFILESEVVQFVPTVNGSVKSISFCFKNSNSNDTEVKYSVFEQKDIKTYKCGNEIKQGSVTVPADFKGYIELPINVSNASDKIAIVIAATEGVSLICSDKRITGAPSFINRKNYHGALTRINKGDSTFCFIGDSSLNQHYSCNNIINGYSRPFGKPNCWISATNENEWLQLDFEQCVDINEVQLYFNAQCETEHFDGPIGQLVTEYKVIITTEDDVIEKHIKDNYLARHLVRVSANKVKNIRFEFIANGGADEFEVFAVKIF